ncbi:hypothetical protein [Streptomyces sp. DW26H14]|uniref:hypothetical protein n=1 Tax=Streptomyces sp. DW26H14 TaxID=3435395 RepID=UPI00403D8CEF
MPWKSRVPDVMDALLAAWRSAPSLAGVTVQDGPFVDQSPSQRLLVVGWTGGDDETSVESTFLQEGLARTPDREQITVRCAAAVLVGSTDATSARRAAYDLMAAAGDAVTLDRTLGLAGLHAGLGTHQMAWAQTKGGAQAIVVFEVTTDGFTGR